MSSFRKRFGNLTVAQVIEMNNVAWKYQKDCDWDPDYKYKSYCRKEWENMLMSLYEWANK